MGVKMPLAKLNRLRWVRTSTLFPELYPSLNGPDHTRSLLGPIFVCRIATTLIVPSYVAARRVVRMGWFDTPLGLKPHGFSVLRGWYPNPSPTALPEPLYVLRRVVVPMQAHATLRAAMPADG